MLETQVNGHSSHQYAHANHETGLGLESDAHRGALLPQSLGQSLLELLLHDGRWWICELHDDVAVGP
jgi:hypothetical protein